MCISNMNAESHVWPDWRRAEGSVEEVPGAFERELTGHADACSTEPVQARLMGGQDSLTEQIDVARLELQIFGEEPVRGDCR